jgi:hypothetical protein
MKFRSVTEQEVKHFREFGWVHLPGYVTREYAGELQSHLESIENVKPADANKVMVGETPYDFRLGDAANADGPGRQMMSAENGQNVSRLLGVPTVRFLKDKWLIKQPQSGSGQAPTAYHQDFPGLGLDRSLHVAIWVSTVDQPAEAGLLRFRSKSHHLGTLGRNYADEFDMHERYPELNNLELSPAWDMKAGDATAHGALTVHGAPANTTDRNRYGYVCQYFDAEALFTGAEGTSFEFIRSDLTPNAPVNHPEMPIIYRKPGWLDAVVDLAGVA